MAVNGSPRVKGNTGTLLRAALRPLDEAGRRTEFVQLGGLTIKGCMACGKCFERRDMQCSNKDDAFNSLFSKLAEADAIILGSPTYFADVSAEIKALIDRTGFVAMANGRVFAGKIGTAVVAARRGGATHVFDTINHLYFLSQMFVPGSTYWNIGYGLDKGEVDGDAEGLANMAQLDKAIAWLGAAVGPHKDVYLKAE